MLSLSHFAQGEPPAADYTIVAFPSEGATLRGQLYKPDSSMEKLPIVVMAHGYSATINGMTADRYAEAYYEAGFAVLLYDHRNFGISGGEPRQEINVWRQARGYVDAIDYVCERSDVDTSRIAIWGNSMAGAEVLSVAAIDHRVAAVISQLPGCGDDPPREDPDGALFESIRNSFYNGDIDGTPETTWGPLPIVSSSPEHFESVMKPSTAFRWFIEYGGRYGSNWKNTVTHVTPEVPVQLDPAIAITHVEAPLLMIVAEQDEMPYCSSQVSRLVFEKAPGPKQLHVIGGGHFGAIHYPSPYFDESCQVQVAFLQQQFRIPVFPH